MALVRIVPTDHFEVLKQYLPVSMAGVVLVPESLLDAAELPKARVELLRGQDGHNIDYNFGGEADLLVDIVTDTGCFAFHALLESLGIENGAKDGSRLEDGDSAAQPCDWCEEAAFHAQ